MQSKLFEIVRESFAEFQSHFKPLVATAAAIFVPLALLVLVATKVLPWAGVVLTKSHGLGGLVAGVLGVLAFWLFVYVPLLIVATFVVEGALLLQIQELRAGRVLTVRETYSRLAPRLPGLLLAAFLVSVLVTIGFGAFVLPGIVVLAFLQLVGPVVVLEGRLSLAALTRSCQLVWAARGEFFWALALFGLASWLGATVVSALVPAALESFASDLVYVVVLPLTTIVTLRLYEDAAARALTASTSRGTVAS